MLESLANRGTRRGPLTSLVSLLLALCLCVLAWGAPARAESEIRAFRFEPRIEVPLLVAGGLGWLLSEQLKPRIAPTLCRFCRYGRFDERAQRARWAQYDRAHVASDWLLFGIVPLVSFGGAVAMALHESSPRTALIDSVVIAEALVLTAGLTQITKYAFGRTRPYVLTQRQERRDFVASPDDNLSFFSGHTSSTFALAVAAGTTASLRGYQAAPALWAVGVPLAALAGYLRIAADRHYVSDVLTGALVGTAVGVLIPWLHARNADRVIAEAPTSMPPPTLKLTWVR